MTEVAHLPQHLEQGSREWDRERSRQGAVGRHTTNVVARAPRLSMTLGRHGPPAPDGAAPDEQEMPMPPSRWGPSSPMSETAESSSAVPAGELASYLESIESTMNSILARLDTHAQDIETLQQKQEELSQMHAKGESQHRAQLNCVTERIWQAEKDLHEAQQRQEDAIGKASAAFEKHAWDVMQDRQHLMMAIDQVNKNFAELSCTIADNAASAKVMEENLAHFQMEVEQVNHTIFTQSGTIQTAQQQQAQLQCSLQAMQDTVMHMTPHSQFLESRSSHRALAEQVHELEARLECMVGDMDKVRGKLHWKDGVRDPSPAISRDMPASRWQQDGVRDPSPAISRDMRASRLPPAAPTMQGWSSHTCPSPSVSAQAACWEDADDPVTACHGSASAAGRHRGGEGCSQSPRSAAHRASSPAVPPDLLDYQFGGAQEVRARYTDPMVPPSFEGWKDGGPDYDLDRHGPQGLYPGQHLLGSIRR